MKRTLLNTLLGGLLLLPGLLQAGGARVVAEDPWIREAPPGMAMLGGFVTLRNTGDTDAALVAARGRDFESVELHRSVIEDGMARMQPQSRIVIPAGGEVQLAPGGYHLMLMGPARALRAGDRSRIELQFENGDRLTVEFVVRRDGGMPAHHHH